MHKQYLIKALELALLGRGKCSPNPSVGAIAVKDNSIIAQAWHEGAGTLHAEQLLVEKFPKSTQGVTLYVTLEPCNHWGRTPPCVDKIIQHGIERVVYAYKDPNPIVDLNGTPSLLREQGIEVIHCDVPEINNFYNSYQYWMTTKRPWVTAKIAHTLNGKIAPLAQKKVMLSNTDCADFTHKQRLYTDVIVTTATTVNIDDPALNARLEGKEVAKHLVVLDAKLAMDQNAQVLQTAKLCHIFYDQSLLKPKDRENCVYHGFKLNNGKFDLDEVICHLGAMGYHDAWIEAGGRLFSALHQARLVNKTYIYIVPKALKSDAVDAYWGEEVLNAPKSVSWQAMGDNMLATIDWH